MRRTLLSAPLTELAMAASLRCAFFAMKFLGSLSLFTRDSTRILSFWDSTHLSLQDDLPAFHPLNLPLITWLVFNRREVFGFLYFHNYDVVLVRMDLIWPLFWHFSGFAVIYENFLNKSFNMSISPPARSQSLSISKQFYVSSVESHGSSAFQVCSMVWSDCLVSKDDLCLLFTVVLVQLSLSVH